MKKLIKILMEVKMKKLFLLLSLVIFLCVPVASHAAGIGGAETVGQGKFGISASQDFILGREGKYTGGAEVGSNTTLEGSSEIDSINRTMVKGSYGLADGLDFYALLGASDFESTLPWTLSGGTNESGEYKFNGDYGVAYGGGMKAKMELENNWIIGCDIQYLEHRNDFSGTNSTSTDSLVGDVTFREWHSASYVAKKIGNFVPYVGAKYSSVKTKYKIKWEDGSTSTLKFDSKNNVGVFLGTDWELNDTWSLNLEGRFVDETAISFSAGYKF